MVEHNLCNLHLHFLSFFYGIKAKLDNRTRLAKGAFTGSVSILIPAHNEESYVVRRIDEFTRSLQACGLEGEIILISDGSTDRTADLASEHANKYLKVLDLPGNIGKAEALMRGRDVALGDIIVLADARQRWEPEALENLLQNFTDPRVGGASGDLIIESAPGMLSGVGLYWKYEKWIRLNESLYHSTVGVTGAISAVRRDLFPRIPGGTILDDVYWPMHVVLQGYRVIHDETALAYDQLPEKASDEFRRKLRTLTGNFQLMALLPVILSPWHNPIWFQFMSHKVMRLIVPWALLAALSTSLLLPQFIYRLALIAQFGLYFIGFVGIVKGEQSPVRLFSVVGSFLLLNVAAFVAFWAWLCGSTTWHKVEYQKIEHK